MCTPYPHPPMVKCFNVQRLAAGNWQHRDVCAQCYGSCAAFEVKISPGGDPCLRLLNTPARERTSGWMPGVFSSQLRASLMASSLCSLWMRCYTDCRWVFMSVDNSTVLQGWNS
ncbi:unnamed protein product [Ostreobium quekettii]|uniref:Uncharacterized protein n=1 Tax=Ostreobium quekettii TaxID=121088 RepID=A0A8S1IQT8_9CHLO|nr:unnamed protein product [Ostreobium quekettii]